MFYVWSFVIGLCSFAVGVFGFCNLIGSIRIRHYRTTALTITTVLVWSVILAIGAVVVHTLLADYTLAYYIATGIALIMSWNTGKNGPEQ